MDYDDITNIGAGPGSTITVIAGADGETFEVDTVTVDNLTTVSGEFNRTSDGLEYTGGEIDNGSEGELVIGNDGSTVIVAEGPVKEGELVITPEELEEISVNAEQEYTIYWRDADGELHYVTTQTAPGPDTELAEEWDLPAPEENEGSNDSESSDDGGDDVDASGESDPEVN